MIIELPEEHLRYLTAKENLIHLDELIKNAYNVKYKFCLFYLFYLFILIHYLYFFSNVLLIVIEVLLIELF